MAFMSCVRTLWGRVGFCSVGSCRLLLSLFDRILGAFFSVVCVGFLSRVFLLWVWGFSCGVVGVEVVSASFQMGSCAGGAHSLRSLVTMLLNICFRSWMVSSLRRGSSVCDGGCIGLVWVVTAVVGMDTPRVVNALQEGHCLACR